MKKCSQQHGKRTIGLLVTAVALLIPTLANAWSLPKGGNWADADDNFQSGLIVNSGLTSNSSQADATNVANQIASDLAYVGANFVRVGVNPYSVADQSWWLVMKSYINQLIARGFNVDLCYWTSSSTVGTVESFPNWSGMWEKIDGVYGTSAHVWYEPINEPHGYSTEAALSSQVYQPFLNNYGLVKLQGWMILDGTGDANNVTQVGADPALTGCKLGLHIYPTWFGPFTSDSAWESQLNTQLDNMQSRTVITEMGAPATSGYDYSTDNSANNDVCFIRGICTRANQLGVGIIYWPSHKDNDGFRLFTNETSGTWTNPSLMDELKSLW
jgi:hypothetical protein